MFIRGLPRLIAVAVLALAAASPVLAPTQAAGSSTSYEKVEVYPAIGTKDGVAEHGRPASLDEPENPGLTYTCRAPLRPLVIPLNQGREYNGTILTLRETQDASMSARSLHKQVSVTLGVRGESLKAVSLIVTPAYYGFIQHDESIVNLHAYKAGNANDYVLETINYADAEDGPAAIDDLTLCVEP